MGRGAVRRGSGLPCGRRATCESAGDGRGRGRRPCLRASASQPRFAGLFVGRRSATVAFHAPGLRWHTGAVVACVFATAPRSPACAGLLAAAGSAAHARPLCASACKVIGLPAARMAFPPSRTPRHPCPWRYRFGVVRLRVPCAPSAAEAAAAAATQQGRPAGRPREIARSVAAVPAT